MGNSQEKIFLFSRSACGRGPPKKNKSLLLVACCLWIYLASQEFSCLVPMLAKRGRRQLACRSVECVAKVNCTTYTRQLIPGPLLPETCKLVQWTRDQGRFLALDLKFLADLKTSTKSAELCKLSYIFHAKRVRRIPFSFMVNSFPFFVICFWKFCRSNSFS